MRPAGQEHWKIISITGHRELSGKDTSRVRSAMKLLVENPTVDAIYFGGALGTDTIALRAAAEFRKGNKPRLVVVVPDTEEAQPFHARQWIHLADETVELHHPITASDGFSAYKKRNEYLVDICTALVAFYSGKKQSGTGHAVQYALSNGVLTHEVRVGQ